MTPHFDPDTFLNNSLPLILASEDREFAYWGGEPLLYWSLIVKTHEGLLNAGVVPSVVKIVTNGSLLTDEIVNKLNEWNVFVVLSLHEGYGEVNWSAAVRLKQCSISNLFTAKTPDIIPVAKKVVQLFDQYGRLFYPYISWVLSVGDCAEEFRFVSREQIDTHLSHLYEIAELRISGNKIAWGLLEPHFNSWSKDLLNESPITAHCGEGKRINIDGDGVRYICHHSIRPELKLPENTDLMRRFVDSNECKVCQLVRWCKGCCPLSETHDIDCYLKKRLHELFTFMSETKVHPQMGIKESINDLRNWLNK
jgi:sulfatase maturation enzyme AslB (radical SAM superfamily)